MRPAPADLFASARHCLYALDIAGDRADVLDVGRAFYAAPFLDERALPETPLGGWRYPLGDLLAAHAQRTIAPSPPLRWIFHVGHCGSTLLSRLLDRLPSVLGLREPLPLLSMAGAWLERDAPLGAVAPARVDAALALVAGLLARGFAVGDRVIVKATSTASLLAPQLLATRPEDRAVLLSLKLPRYLAAYLRDPALRAQARASVAPPLSAWHEWSGDASLRVWQLDDAQCIALTWFIETERYARLARDPATAARVLRLDGDDLVARPAECLANIATHFDLAASADEIAHAVGGDILHRYAKQPDRAYDADAREHDLTQAAERFAPEIAAAVAWADERSAQISRT